MIYNEFDDYLSTIATTVRNGYMAQANERGLQAVHLQILHYLTRCNHLSDSFTSLCQFLGQTKGSLSQSVSLLEKKGLITKEIDQKDRRKSHLKLTSEGKYLAEDIRHPFYAGAQELSEKKQQKLTDLLATLVQHTKKTEGHPIFGTCKQCKHLVTKNKRRKKKCTYTCGLIQDSLPSSSLNKICVHFECD